MSDRILNPSLENSPLQADLDKNAPDFWDRYFNLQRMVSEVDYLEGRFTIDVTNHVTDETVTFENVRLLSTDFDASN
ncbi:hypothetical protein LRY65_03320 [Candidatus Woesebacteria bacterium]|nr:hypothetical protein [Candidatus Woesebacteria bacterium]MCD8507729.1 hypothetical protein [Candidatus Woesebacteria bacterium]MCD8527215.1 hypothetical protein [Candidatus Woesebacteria bacterium]MCD8546580.1 hypothetical protein [Candidatus Woesebacteria bacterium]